MTRRLSVFALLLAGCAPIMEATTHDPARSVIEPAVAARVNDPALAGLITDCVVIHATEAELVRIAFDATSLEGPAPDIAQLIAEIIARPETTQCVRAGRAA